MPYTLMKGLVWILLAVLLGIVIGWLLRSVAAKRQVERARSGNIDHAELERLRARVAELEPAATERLRAEQDAVGVGAGGGPGRGGGAPFGSPSGASPPDDVGASAAPGPTGVAVASEVLGRHVELDDLTVVGGIGPQVAELCHGIGIRTWAELADTEVSLLRTMLADAGQRFAAHDPTTWPDQARMLASGSWAEFVAVTDRLADGGSPD